ncbi:MAG: hypothetical protein ACI82H_000364 [Alphaproteobacteria bacterium]|jgi:hypothetical protein
MALLFACLFRLSVSLFFYLEFLRVEACLNFPQGFAIAPNLDYNA